MAQQIDTPVNEQIRHFGRKQATSLVEGWENAINTVAAYQHDVADMLPNEWLASVGHAQANVTQRVAKAYASTARDLVAR